MAHKDELHIFSKPLASEIIEVEILSRLTIKTLVRFRAVCKSWKMLLSSNHDFIKSHLVRNPNYDSLMLLSRHKSKPGISFNTMFRDLDTYIIGCIDGLVCFSNWYDYFNAADIAIWNPATKQCLQIKPLLFKRKSCSFFGFGFDSITNDYKVIYVPYDVYKPFVADIYSCKAGCWRKTDPSSFLCSEGAILISCFQPVIIHGTPYWLMKANKNVLFVFLFDVHKEVFRLLPDICTFDKDKSDNCVLMNLRDSIAVLIGNQVAPPLESPIHVYVFDERFSVWNKTTTIGPLLGLSSQEPTLLSAQRDLLQCFRSGDILYLSKDGLLYCINPETRTIKILKNLGNHPICKRCNEVWAAYT